MQNIYYPVIDSFTNFENLIKKRITYVLLICSRYDGFILEEDGRINEQIFNEYVSLNLRYPPQFIEASNEKDAYELLKKHPIDLIINMLSPGEYEAFDLAQKIKLEFPKIPNVILTPFSREVSLKLQKYDLSNFDYVFCWLGEAELLLAIIKLIEDKMNAPFDIKEVGVQAILLVEDSVRYYSSYLPNLYKIIFQQSKKHMAEGLNEHQKTMRMRGRPKILLATSYEDALKIYDEYSDSLLGVISDVSYNKDGIKDQEAGFKLTKHIREKDNFLTILLQSSEIQNNEKAIDLGVGFIHKYSKNLSKELKEFVTEFFAFGDFVFKDPKTLTEIERASDLQDLQNKIHKIPDESISYHVSRHDFHRWLRARALFSTANTFRKFEKGDFKSISEIKDFIFNVISLYRRQRAYGVIAQFDRSNYDDYLSFARIGNGSIGGKARGLAFIDSIIKKNNLRNKFENVEIKIPRTLVLSTEAFDDFMEANDLFKIGISTCKDEEILNAFLDSNLNEEFVKDISVFLSLVKNPIAVRSSSLLEDSHYQPFAGIYSTYMIPLKANKEETLLDVCKAIKAVFASVFYRSSKSYMNATSNVIDEEKMGVILQEVVGHEVNGRFYPKFSGVARSVNFYPIEPEKYSEGIAQIALGLGKSIVEGETSLRFSPSHPEKILQLSKPESALNETQKFFYAIETKESEFNPTIDDGANITKFRVQKAEEDGRLKWISSTYDLQNNTISESSFAKGKKIITFSGVLKYNKFPLAEILKTVLEVGAREMNKPIEIEFAVNLDENTNELNQFNWLQIRPIVQNEDFVKIEFKNYDNKDCIIAAESALGNCNISNIYDFVYVKPNSFDRLKTNLMVEKIEDLNEKLFNANLNYVLVGPGRWGSSDPSLGIPVKWSQISAARVIVESGLDDYRIDPSQGTHFFQNLTSFNVGYLTINPFMNDGFYDVDFLSNQKSIYEDEFIRHIRFNKPIKILIDGKSSKAYILKPESE